VRSIFTNKTLLNNLRIKHYGKNFLMFQTEPSKHDGLMEVAYNLDQEPVNLKSWATTLMSTSNTERRNSHFALEATSRIAMGDR
jgi:hypothetical protein